MHEVAEISRARLQHLHERRGRASVKAGRGGQADTANGEGRARGSSRARTPELSGAPRACAPRMKLVPLDLPITSPTMCGGTPGPSASAMASQSGTLAQAFVD